MKSTKLKTYPKTATDNHPPTFSIITPTYNRANLLPRAINSVLAQTFPNFEQIIVDDGSTDNTGEVVENVNDPRIQYFRQENKGRSVARNTGVALARGQYITFLDSDDQALPKWLAYFVQAFTEDKIGAVCCGVNVIKQSGPEQEVILPKDLGALFDHQQGLFLAGTFALRRELFETIGGYNTALAHSENTELALRLVSLCRQTGQQIVNVAQPLIIYHKQPDAGVKGFEIQLESVKYLLAHHRHIFEKDNRVRGYHLAIAGVCAAKIERYGEARHYFKQAILTHPWNWKHYGRLLLALISPLGRTFWLRKNKTTKPLS